MSSTKQIPLLIDQFTPDELELLRRRIGEELPKYSTANPEYEIVYELADDRPADYVRAIQEPEILKTRLKQYDTRTRKTYTLPSFTEVWNSPKSGLSTAILSQSDPHEAKWRLSSKFGYKLATTFMPMYAKSIYEYFGATRVLDPCAGWGDRMVGALSSTCVKRYVGFDPNTRLVLGYKRMQSDFGKAATEVEIHSIPFELCESRLTESDKFDFAFTSPPFFDYEDYSVENPKYRDWYAEFYEPLFLLTERHLEENAFFAVHIDDTSAGKIRDFLFQRVNKITSFQYRGKIGLVGGSSGKIRNVYLFQRLRSNLGNRILQGNI
jgi:16S rRNA G966 N2-methylase RsmD